MSKSDVISIGPKERQWANPPAERSWQRFWGRYKRNKATGIYIEYGAEEEHVQALVKAFQKLPVQLQKLCLEWRVTFSFAERYTASGNSSTFYADFSRRAKDDISPHIEMSYFSLQEDYCLPHLTHELSHLYWRTRPEHEKEKFRQFLRETSPATTVDLTNYLQSAFKDYLRMSNVTPSPYNRGGANISFERWVEESFCETMATIVAPTYPSVRSENTIDMGTRRFVIISVFGFHFVSEQAEFVALQA